MITYYDIKSVRFCDFEHFGRDSACIDIQVHVLVLGSETLSQQRFNYALGPTVAELCTSTPFTPSAAVFTSSTCTSISKQAGLR